MEKQEFFQKIQEVLKEYYQTTPCHNCTIADDLEGCINCHKRHIDTQLWDNVKQLKADYKTHFGTDYDDDYRDFMIKNYRKTAKKKNINNFLNNYPVEDILKVAVELGKTDKMISLDRACEWLWNEIYERIDDSEIRESLCDDNYRANLIGAFREAMEE